MTMSSLDNEFDDDPKHPSHRMINNLKQEDVDKIKAALRTTPLSWEVVGTWRDDHLPCVGIKFAGIEFGFCYLEDDYAAAFHYSDSPTAQKKVRQLIQDAVNEYEYEPLEGEEDEDEDEDEE